MIIDAYNTTQDRRGRSDYLSGVRPGEERHVGVDELGTLIGVVSERLGEDGGRNRVRDLGH